MHFFFFLYFQVTFQIPPNVPSELYGKMSHLILTVHLKKTGGSYESTDQISCVNFLPCFLFETIRVLIGGDEVSIVCIGGAHAHAHIHRNAHVCTHAMYLPLEVHAHVSCQYPCLCPFECLSLCPRNCLCPCPLHARARARASARARARAQVHVCAHSKTFCW